MSNQPRVARVLAALLISMTIGAVVLMALGNHPPSAGAFCLSSYYRLDPVKEALYSQATQSADRWNHIEIYYSDTKAGNIQQLASLAGLADTEDLGCHFVICNGLGGDDGEIQSTEKWNRQWSVTPGKTWYGSNQTIRICLVADGKSTLPTDSQISRLAALTEKLCQKFNIRPDCIYYPANWQ